MNFHVFNNLRPVFSAKCLTLLLALSWGLIASGFAQDKGHGPTASPPGASVYFVDVKNGATIPERTTIHFGLKGMGVAPAGSDRPNSGHHHLLIDAELPALDEPIPSDFNHLHFGAGQTEAEVTLTPGDHTLQLLLGDQNHVPHNPPVMSERIKVRVVEAVASPDASRKPSPPGAKVYFVSPVNNSVVARKTTIRFGLIGMGVAPAGFDKPNTGHHHLLVDAPLPPFDEPIPSDFNHLHFGAGQTEAAVTLPLGHHTLQLLLADANHVPHSPPVFSAPIKVLVTATGRRPSSKVRRHRRRMDA